MQPTQTLPTIKTHHPTLFIHIHQRMWRKTNKYL
jgi:hypothetical protein